MFLYNHQPTSSAGHNCTLTVAIRGMEPATVTQRGTVTRIDQANANPKATFIAMGSPDSPSEGQLRALETASELAWVQLAGATGVSVVAAGSVAVEVPPHGLCV